MMHGSLFSSVVRPFYDCFCTTSTCFGKLNDDAIYNLPCFRMLSGERVEMEGNGVFLLNFNFHFMTWIRIILVLHIHK